MPSKPLVLVADDEPSMLELVGRHLRELEDPSVEVIEASDGEEALRLAQHHLPDLVVLDVMMPGMSGWEVCKNLRTDRGRFVHTGVIMLTGIGEHLNHMTSPLYGADAYIDKPFEFSELDKKVRQVLRDYATQRAAVSRPPVSAPKLEGKKSAKKPAKPAAKPAATKTVKSAPAKLVKKAAPTKAAPKKAIVKKSAPKKSAPKKSAPKKTIAKKSAPKKTIVKKSAPKKVAPKKAGPKKAAKKSSKKR